MALGDRIKEARKRVGLTQAQAAERIGVAKSTWAGYEIGNSEPDIKRIIRIMHELGVDANFLWQDYEDEKSPAPVDAEEEIRMKRIADELNRMFVSAGFIQDGEDISNADRRFIRSVAALISAYFDDAP